MRPELRSFGGARCGCAAPGCSSFARPSSPASRTAVARVHPGHENPSCRGFRAICSERTSDCADATKDERVHLTTTGTLICRCGTVQGSVEVTGHYLVLPRLLARRARYATGRETHPAVAARISVDELRDADAVPIEAGWACPECRYDDVHLYSDGSDPESAASLILGELQYTHEWGCWQGSGLPGPVLAGPHDYYVGCEAVLSQPVPQVALTVRTTDRQVQDRQLLVRLHAHSDVDDLSLRFLRLVLAHGRHAVEHLSASSRLMHDAPTALDRAEAVLG